MLTIVYRQHMFERETSIAKFPNLQGGGLMSNIKLGAHEYASLLTNRSLLKRVGVACMIMTIQQCMWAKDERVRAALMLTLFPGSGINAILYYAAVGLLFNIDDQNECLRRLLVHFSGSWSDWQHNFAPCKRCWRNSPLPSHDSCCSLH